MLDSLDTTVLKTLDFYAHASDLPRIPLDDFACPLVVGSGNGIETGKILFRRHPAFFASESDASDKMSLDAVREVVIVSASGEKHAPILAQQAKQAGKRTILISSTPDSSASRIVDESYIFPKITEPYTYNTSTYFGYLYGVEQGNYTLDALKLFLKNEVMTALQGVDFSEFESFFVVIPSEFALLKNMIETKFIELFGRRVARDVATYEQITHAMTVVPSERELFLCFGNEDRGRYGEHQVNIPIFDREHYAPMMLLAYFVVGQIQNALPPYFFEHIERYCEASPYAIAPIVEA